MDDLRSLLWVVLEAVTASEWHESKAFARSLAGHLNAERPDTITDRRDPPSRAQRVLIDWIPNSPRALTVTPYSLRAADAPIVSAPVGWDEVEAAASCDAGDLLRFDAARALERASADGDLLGPGLELRQRLPA